MDVTLLTDNHMLNFIIYLIPENCQKYHRSRRLGPEVMGELLCISGLIRTMNLGPSDRPDGGLVSVNDLEWLMGISLKDDKMAAPSADPYGIVTLETKGCHARVADAGQVAASTEDALDVDLVSFLAPVNVP